MMKNYYLIGLFLFYSYGCFAEKEKSIIFHADAPEIVYAGRIDFTDSKKPFFCHSGVSIKTVFVGTAMQMILEDYEDGGENSLNYYAIILDGKVRQTLKVQPGKHTYDLFSNLTKEKHTLEVFKRTECMVGKSTFYGFKAPEGTVLMKPDRNTHRIEFIGDSFTCGYGNEVSIPEPPEGNPTTGFHSENENHYLSYSAIAARMLNTEYRCVAYSGRGMYRNNTTSTEGTLPKIYERIIPDDEESALWDMKKEIPDVLVVKLGANDFNPESRGDYLEDKLFVEAYIRFMHQLRMYYPEAKIICVTGVSMSDTFPAGRNCLSRIIQDVKEVVETRKAAGDKEIYYFKLDQQTAPYGEDWHASIATHQKMAEQIAPFIKKIAGW